MLLHVNNLGAHELSPFPPLRNLKAYILCYTIHFQILHKIAYPE